MSPELSAALTAATLALALAIVAIVRRQLAKSDDARPVPPPPPVPVPQFAADDTGRFGLDPVARFSDRLEWLRAEIDTLNARLDRRELAEQKLTEQLETLARTVATLIERTDWLIRGGTPK